MRKKLLYKMLIVFCILVVGCGKDTPQLNYYFKELERQMKDAGYINKIRTTPDDSLYKITGLFWEVHNRYSSSDSLDNIWYKINEKRFLNLDSSTKDEILIFSLKSYLRKSRMDLDKITQKTIDAVANRKSQWKKDENREKKELMSIIEFNDKSFDIGDTLVVVLQTTGDKDYASIFYSLYPFSLNYKSSDSVVITGILTSKFYDKERSGHISLNNSNPLNLHFEVRIINISNDYSHNFGSKKALSAGNMFTFSLELYGRKISTIRSVR